MITALIVIRDHTERLLVRQTLDSGGYSAIEARDSEEAYNKIKKLNPAIIIAGSDNGANEASFIKEVRKRCSMSSPVIMITGELSLDKQIEFNKAGATCTVARPVEPHKLLSAVELVTF